MARLLQILTSCVVVLCCSKTRMCYRRKEPATSSCRFCRITQITTYNMNTTIYWKSNFSHQDTSIHYEMSYDDGRDQWINVSCVRPQWHADSGEMSCGILTCETTRVAEWYEFRVKAYGNSSSSFVTPSVLHNPTQDNVPLKITDVNITSNSSSSAMIDWRLPPNFCAKSKYCMEFTFQRQGAKNDEQFRLSVLSANATSSWVTGLDSCSKYLFYLTVYEEDSCSFSIAAHWTTGPFVLPSSNAAINLTPHLRVLNFNTTLYWSEPESCSLETSQFSVYYRSAEPAHNWSKSSCIVKQDTTNKFSCQFLTCADTDEHAYEVQVRVNGSSGRMENILFFLPSLHNFPDKIHDVTITALTSSSLRISWELAPTFCSRFEYCLIFFYHGNESGNKTMQVSEDELKKQSIIVNNVLAYTKYYFYAVTFRPALGCLYAPEYSEGGTGSFAGTTLEDVPSSPPILICSFCDVIVHSKTRSGIVRWQLPPKTKWNGVPRVFIIQWLEKEKANTSEPIWNNKTIRKIDARDANLTGLRLDVEYVVRVRMCNGELCSKFSNEMTIGVFKKKGLTSQEQKSHAKTIAIGLGVTFAVLAVIFSTIVYFKVKKCTRSRATANTTSLELPTLECLSYENIATATVSSYSQLSPTEDCYLDTEITDKSGNC